MMSNHDIPNIPVAEIKELLDAVGEKVPGLIKELMATVYSAEAGQELGKAAGGFHKELIASGIPEEDALDMTKSYIASLQGIMNKVRVHGVHGAHGE